MRAADALRLVVLAAIWGASFNFIRVTAPVLGPIWTTEGRLLIGGVALLAWLRLAGFDAGWRTHIRFYALIGIIGSAIPFTLIGFAGMHISASMMAILNTTAPMFALLLAAAFGVERIAGAKIAGLVLGAAGVWLVTRSSGGEAGAGSGPMFLWAVAACLCACFAYGLTGLMVKRWSGGAPSRGIAVGAQVCGAIVLLPLLPVVPPLSAPSPTVAYNLLALGILGNGIAYILFFRLLADIGPTRTQTVSFLVPAFALLWGVLFLDEALGWNAIAGAALILGGTVLITRSR